MRLDGTWGEAQVTGTQQTQNCDALFTNSELLKIHISISFLAIYIRLGIV